MRRNLVENMCCEAANIFAKEVFDETNEALRLCSHFVFFFAFFLFVENTMKQPNNISRIFVQQHFHILYSFWLRVLVSVVTYCGSFKKKKMFIDDTHQ